MSGGAATMGGGKPMPMSTCTPAIVGTGTNIKTKTEATNNITFFIQPPIRKMSRLILALESPLSDFSGIG
jgi:hypothetical protein